MPPKMAQDLIDELRDATNESAADELPASFDERSSGARLEPSAADDASASAKLRPVAMPVEAGESFTPGANAAPDERPQVHSAMRSEVS